ncbi:hypothetical protein CBL_01238 [Carabus blaptoides fortunei]
MQLLIVCVPQHTERLRHGHTDRTSPHSVTANSLSFVITRANTSSLGFNAFMKASAHAAITETAGCARAHIPLPLSVQRTLALQNIPTRYSRAEDVKDDSDRRSKTDSEDEPCSDYIRVCVCGSSGGSHLSSHIDKNRSVLFHAVSLLMRAPADSGHRTKPELAGNVAETPAMLSCNRPNGSFRFLCRLVQEPGFPPFRGRRLCRDPAAASRIRAETAMEQYVGAAENGIGICNT